eukprot:TRINITY_DN1187_c0_g1_i1.p1 TRINITY_DN1187_c0_g1~~TRINITY_DN1187_c0_g1_i1.p1  ORF type:complete len:447 (-),score=89.88 TRINITY_DN1187_c0_g1_i1:30-1370(-)
MRELVNVQIGGGGTQIGTKYWETISEEHGLDAEGVYKGDADYQQDHIGIHFAERQGGAYRPRTVVVDLDAAGLDSVRESDFGKLISPDNLICGGPSTGTGSNWAKGHYTIGAELVDSALEVIRKEQEPCEYFQGFQFLHSIGGGTGSGLGTLLMSKLKEEFCSNMFQTSTIVPSPDVSNVVVEPYNAVLSMHQMIENMEECIVFDNHALYNVCKNTLKLATPTYGDLNHIVAQAMSGITCSMRFPGQTNLDLKKIHENLVPFPRLKWLTPSVVPLTALGSQQQQTALTVQELADKMLHAENMLCAVDPHAGKFLTACAIFRGRVSTKAVDEALNQVQEKESQYFTNWIPSNIKASICDVPGKGVKTSVTCLSNHTAVKDTFKRVAEGFTQLFRRKAYLHWYTGEGMDEMEFTEAECNLNDMISEYQQFAEDHGEEEEEEEEEEHEG